MVVDLDYIAYPYKWVHDRTTRFFDIYEWCESNFGKEGPNGKWVAKWPTIFFANEKDYVAFRLRWS